MKGRPVVAAAAAKRHTLVLTAAGEVYTWGHRGVSPRRVQLAGARDTGAQGGAPISFHRGHADVARPVAAAICAGAAHSSALTTSGVVLTWRSADPALQVRGGGRSWGPLLAAHACLAVPSSQGSGRELADRACRACPCCAWPCCLQVQEVRGALAGKRAVSIAAGGREQRAALAAFVGISGCIGRVLDLQQRMPGWLVVRHAL